MAALLPTSQWDEKSITTYAAHFSHTNGGQPKVLKFDMDMVEVLGILRPSGKPNLTLSHLGSAFRIASEMIEHNPRRLPSASVSFLGAHANALVDGHGREPTFEAVLRTMYEAGYTGDVYPPPALWQTGNVGVFARFPFSPALETMRGGGF